MSDENFDYDPPAQVPTNLAEVAEGDMRTDDDPPRPSGVPEALGYGYLSSTESIMALVLDINESGPATEEAANTEFSFDFVYSRSSFSRTVAGSARAKFPIKTVDVSAKVSRVRTYRSEKTKVHILLHKRVSTTKHFLRDPVVRREAKKAKAPFPFLDRYGDHYVHSVTLGGELAIVCTVAFERESQASTFSASVKAKWPKGSAGASLYEAIKSESANGRIVFQGFASGVRGIPGLFEATKGGLKTPETDAKGVIERIISFWDGFEEAVRTDNVAVPVAVNVRPISRAKGCPDGISGLPLLKLNQALSECEELDDVIDQRIASLEYLKEKATEWNPQVKLVAIDDKLNLLLARKRELEGWVDQAANLVLRPLPSNPPFTESQLPAIPNSWICRDLALQLDEKWQGANTGFERTYRLPQSYDEQYVLIAIDFSKQSTLGLVSRADLLAKFDSGERLGTWRLGGNITAVAPQFTMTVPARATAILLRGATYDGQLCKLRVRVYV